MAPTEQTEIEKLQAQLRASQKQTQRFKKLYADANQEREKWQTKSRNQHKNLKFLNRKLRTLYDGMKLSQQKVSSIPIKVEI